jgi:hypothetical protein
LEPTIEDLNFFWLKEIVVVAEREKKKKLISYLSFYWLQNKYFPTIFVERAKMLGF